MKITRESLARIIEEELGEMLRPRMNVGSSGLTGPPPAPEMPTGPVMVQVPIDALQDVYGMVKAEHDLSKADNQTPERVIQSLSRIAGTLVDLL